MTKRDQEIPFPYIFTGYKAKVEGYKAKVMAKVEAEAEVRRIFKKYEAEIPKNAKVEKLRIFKRYEVEKLKKDEAIDLFMKAYGKDQPTGGFEEVLDRAVEYAKGIPLALQVLGSFLKGRSKGECVRLLSSTYELVEQITISHRQKIFKHDLINLLGWNIGKRSGWDEAQEDKHRREKEQQVVIDQEEKLRKEKEQQVVIDQEEKLRKGKEQLDGNKYLLGTGSFTRLPGPALWPNLKYLRDVSLVYCTQCQLLDFCYISRHLVFLEILCVSQNLATQQLDSWLSLPNLRVLMLAKCYFPEAFPETTKLPSSSISQLDHLHTTDEFMMVDRFQIDDFSFLAPFLGCYLTITPGHLKVRIESLQYIFEWMILDKSASLKCLESERHSFSTPSSRPGLPLEQLEVLSFRNSVPHCRELMHKENVFLENLEINGCSSMSFPIKSKLATNLRQLKITNCTSLQTLPVGLIHNNSSLEMLHIQGCPSLISFPESEPSSLDSASNTFLKLTKLEIWDCVKLKSLPLSLHQFSFLTILSISNCPCLVSFPEGGLPSDLTSLLIYECESLRFLPDNMHKLASLQVLSINGCPSLTFFPEGGLPTNLVSLSVIDCESLCPLYQWQLHKLIKLEQFTVMGVCSHLDL